MSNTKKTDYSELVLALQQNKEGKASEILKEVLYRLKDYLKVVMNANEKDSEEAIQQAFLNVYEQIRKDNIKNEKYIFSYMLRAARHEYIRLTKDQHRFNYLEDYNREHLVEPAQQIENLIDQDRQLILEACLKELEEESREFIEHFIDKPDTTTKQASKHFKISGANVRTKKSRILSRLHHCFKRKWDK